MIKKYYKFIIGLVIIAFSFNLFFVPDHLVSSGISGLAVIFNYLFNTNNIMFIFISNIFLIIISYFTLGKEATYKTIFGSILFPIFINITSFITNYIDISSVDLLTKSIAGGVLYGFGLGLVFKTGFTTGGTDIIEAIICKYLSISMDYSILITEGFIVILCGIIFGLDYFVYAIIILLCISFSSNKFMLDINDDKLIFINSRHNDEIMKYLEDYYHYGVTAFNTVGGYSYKKNKVLMVSVPKRRYQEIRKYIRSIDKNAFISVLNSYETNYIMKDEKFVNDTLET